MAIRAPDGANKKYCKKDSFEDAKYRNDCDLEGSFEVSSTINEDLS